MEYQYDIIVLGAGSGGLVIASASVQMGARVLLIEKRKMGGDCLNYGCVPSKAFLKSSHLAKQIKNSNKYGLRDSEFKVSLKDIMMRVQNVVEEISYHDSKERYEALGVQVKFGRGKLVSSHEVKIGEKIYTGKKIVIATGSKGMIPPIKGLDRVCYHTNETIFSLKEIPKKLVILGAGPIGLELGQGFSNLGVEVHIIDRSEKLFTKDEPEVSNIMEEELIKDGLNFHLGCAIEETSQEGEKIKIVILKDDIRESIECDTLLVALGRKPNTEEIGLEEVGVKVDQRGFIEVNDYLQTSISNIYACGDCKGKFLFTHAASYEASIIVKNALLFNIFKPNYKTMPWTTYTLPEVSHVGYLENDARKENILGSVYRLPISDNDRAKTDNDRIGFIKIILDKKSRVIGGTIVGNKAGDLLNLLSYFATHKIKLSKVLPVIYQYPVQGEIVKSIGYLHLKENIKPWQKKILEKIISR